MGVSSHILVLIGRCDCSKVTSRGSPRTPTERIVYFSYKAFVPTFNSIIPPPVAAFVLVVLVVAVFVSSCASTVAVDEGDRSAVGLGRFEKIRSKLLAYFGRPPPQPFSAGLNAILKPLYNDFGNISIDLWVDGSGSWW